MPDSDDRITTSPPTLPPGDLSAAELMKAVFPLVVQAASQSAAAATAAAQQGKSLEDALAELKRDVVDVVRKNSEALESVAKAKEYENQLLAEKNEREKNSLQTKTETTKEWHQTLRTTLTSPVALQLIQLVIIILSAFGLWTQFPKQLPTDLPPSATVSEDPNKP